MRRGSRNSNRITLRKVSCTPFSMPKVPMSFKLVNKRIGDKSYSIPILKNAPARFKNVSGKMFFDAAISNAARYEDSYGVKATVVDTGEGGSSAFGTLLKNKRYKVYYL